MENFTMKHLGYIVAALIVIVIAMNIASGVKAQTEKFEDKATNLSITELITE